MRTSGLRGCGSEDAFLSMSLNHHFGCKGPEGWHVQSKIKGDGACMAGTKLKRRIRNHRIPQWFHTPLTELRIVCCKYLPRPWAFGLLPHEQCMAASGTTTTKTARRNTAEQHAKAEYNPDRLLSSFWTTIGTDAKLLLRSCTHLI